MPSYRFFTLIACLILGLCTGYSALVLSSATWAEARQLDMIFPFYTWRIQPFSAIELSRIWKLLAGGAALLLSTATMLASGSAARAERAAWQSELNQAFNGLRIILTALSAVEQRIATGTLAALTALRLFLSLPAVTPGYDDVPSYELFASKSFLAVSAYYPVPNNHVLSNTISWLFYHLDPGFWFTMRLPVVLEATGATVLLFTGLLWARAGFRPALLATLLFGLSQLSLYHAAVGRGYWLVTALAGTTFFCTLALRRPQRLPRIAWTGLIVSGVLGTYTVPTFILVLVSAISWLGLFLLQRKFISGIANLVFMSVTIVAGILLLYTPLLFISGSAIFFSNGFIAPHPWAEFWHGLPAYIWETEGFLTGQMKIGALLTVTGTTAGIGLFWWARKGQVPAALLSPGQNLIPAALWFMVAPYSLLIAQRVFAPSRTLLYKAFFIFLLLALAIEWLLRLRKSSTQQRRVHLMLGLSVALWLGYQLTSMWRESQQLKKRNEALHTAFEWLDHQPRGPMLIPESTQNIFVRMYVHSERQGQQWQIDNYPQPNVTYSYVMAFPEHHGLFQPRFPYPPAFHNEQAEIYVLVNTNPNSNKKSGLPYYWHQAQ